MRRITFRLMIAVLTFAVGSSVVWLVGLYPKVETTIIDSPAISSFLGVESLDSVLGTKFKPTGRACGMGYVQGYELPDGQRMSEGSMLFRSPALAKKGLKEMLAKASRIVERVPKSKNRLKELGERIMMEFPPDETGKGSVSIVWYDGGDLILFIDAPSLEIALEFEKANAYAH